MCLTCSADLVDTHFFVEDFGLRSLVVDEGVGGVVADDIVVFDVDEGRVRVNDGHAEVVIESHFEGTGFKRRVPVRRRFRPKPKVPFTDNGGVVTGVFGDISNRLAIRVEDKRCFEENG